MKFSLKDPKLKNLHDQMRQTGDGLADAVAEIIWRDDKCNIIEDLKSLSRDHSNLLSENVKKLKTYQYLDEEEKKVLDEYFVKGDHLCDSFTDEDRAHFKVSGELFDKYGYFITFLLFFKSLPTGYMCPKPAEVLHSTKLLEKFAARRVMETAQFVFAVNEPDWSHPLKLGWKSIQKVRLMHAGMRLALLRGKPGELPWDTNTLGVPINQEDLVLTNYLFSVTIIEGLDMMGVHLLPDERESVYHTWQKIGSAMGIEDALLFPKYEDGCRHLKYILDRNISKENKSGPPLTKALLKSMEEIMSRNIPYGTLENLTMYFINDSRVWDSLGLEKPKLWERIASAIIHKVLSWKIWQILFHRKRNYRFMKIVNNYANKVITKMFGLNGLVKHNPNLPPLEIFSKVIGKQLHERDLANFQRMSPEERQKHFIIGTELFNAWDLGAFELNEG